jgi:RES domain-containing protein
MPLRPHPRSAALLKWFSRHKRRAHAVEGEFYRVAGPRHTTAKDIVSGEGAFIAGGRWNPIGEMKVVYLSQEPETATAESLEHFRYHHLPVSRALPKVIVAVAVRIDRLLDLTDRNVVAGLPIPMSELLAEDWRALMVGHAEAGAQAVGSAAFAAGIQGLKVPSKPAPNGINFVVFPENFTRGCRLEVLNASDLEKLGKPS